MGWLAAWWRQIVGPPPSDPWHSDERIQQERQGQHARIDRATELILRDEYNRRLRESWRAPRHDG